MKTPLISYVISIITVAFCLAIVACSQEQTSEIPHENISDAEYISSFNTFHFDTIAELYQGLRDLNSGVRQSIRDKENQYKEDTLSKTLVTDEERKNGIFENLRNRLLREETLMVPYYLDKEIPPDNRKGYSGISLLGSYFCRKPWIFYSGVIDDTPIGFYTMYYDKNLLDEANKKGASWLISQINPEGINIHNYDKYYPYVSRLYEKNIQLGDREVISMVIEVNDDPEISIYFVYDDILVSVCRKPEFLEAVLPEITFREVSLTTGKPLRDKPGREDTKYSTMPPVGNDANKKVD